MYVSKNGAESERRFPRRSAGMRQGIESQARASEVREHSGVCILVSMYVLFRKQVPRKDALRYVVRHSSHISQHVYFVCYVISDTWWVF